MQVYRFALETSLRKATDSDASEDLHEHLARGNTETGAFGSAAPTQLAAAAVARRQEQAEPAPTLMDPTQESRALHIPAQGVVHTPNDDGSEEPAPGLKHRAIYGKGYVRLFPICLKGGDKL